VSGRGSKWIRRAEGVAALALIGAVIAVLLTRSSPATGNAGSSQGTSTTSAPGAAAGPGQGQPAPSASHSALVQLQQKAASASHGTFMATYQAKGSNTTILFARMGSRSSISTGTTTFYSDGTSNTVCDTSSGTPSCYTGAQPLAGLLSPIDPAEASSAIQSVVASGVSVSYSTEHHDGLLSSCISYPNRGQHVKYCMNSQGVVIYLKIPTGAFQLTSYTTRVPDAYVSVPANATFHPAP
jgi:hypothetical protein